MYHETFINTHLRALIIGKITENLTEKYLNLMTIALKYNKEISND